ncbi:DNA gyrase subunit A [bacterium]|nr:DNA gyrase subunit A [bacterium]MBU1782386.1 DNA gyrase subunit A [bacterium]
MEIKEEIKERIIPVYIEDKMKSFYIDYAMSVIVGRALPDVRDGLKPVHRRILYAMNELGSFHNRPFKKSARIVGEVLGKYHPHGDTSVYEAMVRMAQDFSSRYCLVEGQGNFGSVDGDPPAAMRYTEVRLDSLAELMLADIDKETVSFTPNFDDTLKEPLVLPSKIPNLIINGSSGIAVGMATNIPPHNLAEVIDGVISIIEQPEIEIEELIKGIPGPDFPTGGIICGTKGIKEAYHTGRGCLTIRAKADIQELKQSREQIIITEIPYQVNKADLISKMADLVKDKKIEGISEIRDESDRDGLRVVIEVKRGENANIVLNQLYKHTQMQTTFGVIMLALVDNQPRVLNLKEVLSNYLEHRKEVIIRRTRYELSIAETRAHILEGLKIALNNIDAIINTIRSSKSALEAKQRLINEFNLSDKQAQAILEMQLQRLAGLEQEKINNEYLNLIKLIANLKSILMNEQKVLEIIKEELLEIKEKFKDKRRTEIKEEIIDFKIEDLIPQEDMVIVISHAGYIKRLAVDTYRMQRRGGVGVTGMGFREEDFIEHLLIASTHSYILLFTNLGRIYWLKVYEIPEGERTHKGKAMINLISLNSKERITTFAKIEDFNQDNYFVMITKKGIIKKVKVSVFSKPRPGGIIALSLDPGDELIGVKVVRKGEEIIIVTKKGKAIRFNEESLRSLSRIARGVKGIRMALDDEVVSMEIVREEETLLTVSEKGYGKRTFLKEYRSQNRGGFGIINMKVNTYRGWIVSSCEVEDQDEVVLISEGGMVIRFKAKDIPVTGRNTRGVRIIKLNENDKLVALAKIPIEEKIEEKDELK